jgi:single-strand DNA-binding protein
MRSVNKVILIGNVTRNPELRQTQSGQAVCTFGLATNREWITSDGRKKQSAEYHEVVAWARLADICEKYVRKGKLLYVEGYLKTRSWDTPEGTRKFKTEVVIQDMIMLEKRGDGTYEEYDASSMGGGDDDDYNYDDDDNEEDSSNDHQGDDQGSNDDDDDDSSQSAQDDDSDDEKNDSLIDADLGL